MNATAREEVRGDMATSGGEAASLVESAMLLRWRAPELALLLADRAVVAAGKDRSTLVRADHLAVVALNRLGRHGEAAQRLLPVLPYADVPAELRHELQIELAQCAAALGEPGTALAALRPVLAAGDDAAPVLRGTALLAAAESCIALGRGDVVPGALEEADELFREDLQLDRDTALLLRATAKMVNAARHRRAGAAAECEAQARLGRELLTGWADPEHDSGQVSARLMLETVLALLDRGEGDAAVYEARPMLRRPVRAAAAGAVGWLRLAIATRVHLAKGRHEPALGLLADAVEVTQRHGADVVLAECLEGLSHVHEVRGEFADALHCLRSARAAERRHRRRTDAARYAVLEQCGVSRREVPRVIDQIVALLPGPGWLRVVPDPDTGLLDADEYDCRVEAALIGSAVHSQVLIAVGSGAAQEPAETGLLVELSRWLRKAAPAGAALGQITSDRIAVLLPAMNRHQAQLWAQRFRAVSAAQLGVDLTVGVAQYRAKTGADQFLADTVAALRAATDAARPAPVPTDAPTLGIRATPGPRMPESAVRGSVIPGSVVPDTVVPDTVVPDTVAPNTVAPDTVVLEVVPDRLDRVADSPQVGGDPLADVERAPARPEPPAEIAPTPVEPDPLEVTPEQVAREPVTASPAAPAHKDPPAEPPAVPETRHGRGNNGTSVLVSDLLPLSLLSAGRSGRRRAEDRTEDTAGPGADESATAEERGPAENATTENAGTESAGTDGGRNTGRPHPQTGPLWSFAPFGQASLSEPAAVDNGVNGATSAQERAGIEHASREFPVAGPPPAPMPRALEWASNGAASRNTEADDVGMGDLLAEALAAFQESGHTLGGGVDTAGPAAGENSVDAASGHGPRGRRAPSVQLATDPVDRRQSNATDALTDPELRLPDLTAEPLWRPPGSGRRSAAGD